MKFQVLLLALLFAFSPFIQAQDVPSEEEKKEVLNYVNKYHDLQSVVENSTQQFNELTVRQKGSADELTAAKQIYISNIDEAIKIFNTVPVPAACKEVQVKMLAEMNGMRIIVGKIADDSYQLQANKEQQCTNCSAAKLRAFKLREAAMEKQSAQSALEMGNIMTDLGKKYGFSLSKDPVQAKKNDVFNKGRKYVDELMLIIAFFTDAHGEMVDAINSAIESSANAPAFAKAITKYQNDCKAGNKLLLAFPKSYNGDGSLYKIGQELATFTANFGQKTLPTMLAACSKPNRLAADINIINAAIEEHEKGQAIIDNSSDVYYTFIGKLLEASK